MRFYSTVFKNKAASLVWTGEAAREACELGDPMFQQGEITHKLICGLVEYDKAVDHPILDSLPSAIHLNNIKSGDAIWMTVRLIDAEMETQKSNRSAIVDRLTEVLFLQILHAYARKNGAITGFFSALGNPRVRRVLELIHRQPELAWTLDQLGEQTGMSRATLLRQFKNELGVSVMSYIAHWRMTKAYQLLKYSSANLEQVSEQVGFATARTLNKAFQRQYGITPSQLRRSTKR